MRLLRYACQPPANVTRLNFPKPYPKSAIEEAYPLVYQFSIYDDSAYFRFFYPFWVDLTSG